MDLWAQAFVEGYPWEYTTLPREYTTLAGFESERLVQTAATVCRGKSEFNEPFEDYWPPWAKYQFRFCQKKELQASVGAVLSASRGYLIKHLRIEFITQHDLRFYNDLT